MRRNNSLLVESAAALAEAETGSRPSLTGARHFMGIPVGMVQRVKQKRGVRWTAEEDTFLRKNVGYLSDAEIGKRLGRSWNAIHQRRERDLHLLPPRQDPRWITANQIANGLGKDDHSIHKLIDRGLLPGRLLPMDMVTRVVDRQELLRWILDPLHWCYFDPQRVGSFQGLRLQHWLGHPDVVFWRQARKQVLERRRVWNDEWMRIGDVAKLLGFKEGKWLKGAGKINLAIHIGVLQATDWGNWWILKSEALRFQRERIIPGWGPRKIDRINYRDYKPDWPAIVRKRAQNPNWINRFARIHERDVFIRKMIRRGITLEALGKKYHMTAANVRRIVKKGNR